MFQFGCYLLLMGNSIKLIFFIRLRAYRTGLIAAVLAFLSSLALWTFSVREGPGLPAGTLLLLTLTALSLYNLRSLLHWRRENLSERSVKESFDLLPTGICCYWESGLPKLCNRKMNEICRALTGEPLFDAAAFWQALTAGTLPASLQGGERPIAVLGDGTAYSFVRHAGTLDGEPICEIIAADITEEYRLTDELHEKQKHANYFNLRLRAMQSELSYTVMDSELLQIKTRVHDSLGETLLATRQYLSGRGTVDADTLQRLWSTNIRLLENSEPEQFQKPYFIAKQRAEWLGITLEITGNLPEDEALIPVIDTALTVHLTNLLRHAEGKTGYLTVREDAGFYELHFTNDGKPPQNGVQETGGLQNLRRIVEQAGGGMKIRALPRFEMILRLPRA